MALTKHRFTHQRENNWEENEPVPNLRRGSWWSTDCKPTHPKEHDEQEDLEEGGENVGVAADEEDEGDQGGDATVEDGGAHVHHGSVGSLLLAAWHGEEGVADVHWNKIMVVMVTNVDEKA